MLKYSFPLQEKVTVADVAVWSVLYPLYGDNTFNECLDPFTNVARWFKKLEVLDEFKVHFRQSQMCIIYLHSLAILECYNDIQSDWHGIVQCVAQWCEIYRYS